MLKTNNPDNKENATCGVYPNLRNTRLNGMKVKEAVGILTYTKPNTGKTKKFGMADLNYYILRQYITLSQNAEHTPHIKHTAVARMGNPHIQATAIATATPQPENRGSKRKTADKAVQRRRTKNRLVEQNIELTKKERTTTPRQEPKPPDTTDDTHRPNKRRRVT